MSDYFSGGEKMKAALAATAARLKNATELQVGFYDTHVYPVGDMGLPDNAALQEFGDGKIPPRPFFRQMVARDNESWSPVLLANLNASGGDSEIALTALGVVMQEQVKESISLLTEPPLSPRTIANKGSSKPLIETGLLLNNVEFKVI